MSIRQSFVFILLCEFPHTRVARNYRRIIECNCLFGSHGNTFVSFTEVQKLVQIMNLWRTLIYRSEISLQGFLGGLLTVKANYLNRLRGCIGASNNTTDLSVATRSCYTDICGGAMGPATDGLLHLEFTSNTYKMSVFLTAPGIQNVKIVKHSSHFKLPIAGLEYFLSTPYHRTWKEQRSFPPLQKTVRAPEPSLRKSQAQDGREGIKTNPANNTKKERNHGRHIRPRGPAGFPGRPQPRIKARIKNRHIHPPRPGPRRGRPQKNRVGRRPHARPQ